MNGTQTDESKPRILGQASEGDGQEIRKRKVPIRGGTPHAQGLLRGGADRVPGVPLGGHERHGHGRPSGALVAVLGARRPQDLRHAITITHGSSIGLSKFEQGVPRSGFEPGGGGGWWSCVEGQHGVETFEMRGKRTDVSAIGKGAAKNFQRNQSPSSQSRFRDRGTHNHTLRRFSLN